MVNVEDYYIDGNVDWEKIRCIPDIELIVDIKQSAIKKQMFELATVLRDQERFLLTEEGYFWAIQERNRIKREKRDKKLKRILK